MSTQLSPLHSLFDQSHRHVFRSPRRKPIPKPKRSKLDTTPKRPRGRPKGSKNKPKIPKVVEPSVKGERGRGDRHCPVEPHNLAFWDNPFPDQDLLKYGVPTTQQRRERAAQAAQAVESVKPNLLAVFEALGAPKGLVELLSSKFIVDGKSCTMREINKTIKTYNSTAEEKERVSVTKHFWRTGRSGTSKDVDGGAGSHMMHIGLYKGYHNGLCKAHLFVYEDQDIELPEGMSGGLNSLGLVHLSYTHK